MKNFFLIKSIIYCLVAIMCLIGVYYTYYNNTITPKRIIKVIVLIVSAVIFVIFSFQYLRDFLKKG